MITNTEYIMQQGMDSLIKVLGPIYAAEFIMNIKSDRFDYCEWRRNYFDKMQEGEFHQEAVAYAKTNPYKGNAKIIIG